MNQATTASSISSSSHGIRFHPNSDDKDQYHSSQLDVEAEGDDDDEDDDDEGEAEAEAEHTLLWDAQNALIAHHTELAIRIYSQAALRPYCSVPACLALGNLLIRGSGFTSSPSTPLRSPGLPLDTALDKVPLSAHFQAQDQDQSTWTASTFRTISRLFRRPTHSTSTHDGTIKGTTSTSTTTRRDIASTGWTIPKEGKRAVREPEAMGVAGAWFVLGLGWLVQSHIERESRDRRHEETSKLTSRRRSSDEEMLVFNSKSKREKSRSSPHLLPHQLPISSEPSTPSYASNASSGDTLDSPSVKTPGTELHQLGDSDTFDLMFELLQPLLHLYRNGHIQAHDPVALPPISIQQLPSPLRPINERQKGRNTWNLGGVIVRHLLRLFAAVWIGGARGGKEGRVRASVYIMANYIAAMTSSDEEAETCFRNIVLVTLTGNPSVDQLIHQAGKRLNIITSTPREENKGKGGFPFPQISPLSTISNPITSPIKHYRRVSSAASMMSTRTAPRILSSPRKSVPSSPSMLVMKEPISRPACDMSGDKDCAELTLRRIHARSSAQLSSLSQIDSASESRPGRASLSPPTRVRPIQLSPPSPSRQLRPIASSPQFGTLRPVATTTASSTPRRRLPFEPTATIATIDPELAKAELASALTKHVICGVCGIEGVNYPECRKCGLTFCSRGCRVDEDKAGNGKRHVCGLWEGRKGVSKLTVAPLAPWALSPGQCTKVC